MEVKQELKQKIEELEKLINFKQQQLGSLRQQIDVLAGEINILIGKQLGFKQVLEMLMKDEAIDEPDKVIPAEE